eukprot:6190498-Pleurochrysis_carterae.AAC.1
MRNRNSPATEVSYGSDVLHRRLRRPVVKSVMNRVDRPRAPPIARARPRSCFVHAPFRCLRIQARQSGKSSKNKFHSC